MLIIWAILFCPSTLLGETLSRSNGLASLAAGGLLQPLTGDDMAKKARSPSGIPMRSS